MLKRMILHLIRLYQRYISPDQGILKTLWIAESGVCRFEPRCSQYTFQAIDKYGLIKGGILGLKRIIRCHPWSRGGRDLLK